MYQTNDIHPLQQAVELRLLADVLELQHLTSQAASIRPIPMVRGEKAQRFVAYGTAAEVARLLEIAPVAPAAGTPRVDALMAKWSDDGATRGSAFIELRDLARELERAAPVAAAAPAATSDLMAVDCPACEAGAACDECSGQGKIIVSRTDMAALASAEHDHSEGGHHD